MDEDGLEIDKVRQEGAVNDLDPAMTRQNALRLPGGQLVGPILGLIIGEIRAQVFYIEPGLVLGVEPDNEFIQTGPSHDQRDLVFGPWFH